MFTAVDPDRPFTPNFDADVCFGLTVSYYCRNVVYDPPDHLPVWDLALAAYRAELDELPVGRDAARVQTRPIGAASHRIAAMEQACRARPGPVLTRLLRELERYLDYVRFDTDIPGSAAQYRPLYLACTRYRVRWVCDLLPTQDRPDWSLPATSELLLADRA